MSYNVRDWMTAQEANEYDKRLAAIDQAVADAAPRCATCGERVGRNGPFGWSHIRKSATRHVVRLVEQ